MRGDRHDDVRVVLCQEKEAPVAVDARLPEVAGFVVFLGAQRGMIEVLRQQPNLLLEGLLDCERRAPVIPLGAPRMCPGHGGQDALRTVEPLRPLRESIISSTVPNGPRTRPFRTSSRPSAIARSTKDFGVSVILPLSTFASRMSPTATPIRSLTARGMTTWYLFLTFTMDM